jgi:hypothetical protein
MAQEQLHQIPVAAKDSIKLTQFGFERELNTFLWNARLSYDGTFGDWTVNTQQSIRSRLIRIEQHSVQDEYKSQWEFSRPLSGPWRIGAQVLSNVLSDNTLVDLGQLAQYQGLAGVAYDGNRGLTMNALGGYEYNAQGDQRDHGFSYLMQTQGKGLMFEDFRVDLLARTAQSFLAPRRQRDDNLSLSLDRQFGPDAQNTISVYYSNQRREFYTAADSSLLRSAGVSSNIFRREARVLDVSERLRYQTGDGLLFFVQGGILNRMIDRSYRYKEFSSTANSILDTRIQEQQLYGNLELQYQAAAWYWALVALEYRERGESHEVTEDTAAPLDVIQRQESAASRLGNMSHRTSIRTAQRINLSLQDQLNVFGSASILRYDTPDTLNTDDRDELLMSFGVEAVHTANRYLRVTISADAVLNHLVYLHRLQSANNTWNRIIRFSPKVEYTPTAWLRTVNSAEVLANYTAYDFEDQVAFVKSFSFRQASWSDSTLVRLAPAVDLSFVGTVRVFERGILHWSDFKERPENYFVEQSYWPQIQVWVGQRLHVGVGYRFFAQDRYKYLSGSREFERRLQTGGPTAFLHWVAAGFHEFTVQGWRETQQDGGMVVRTVSNLSMKVSIAL